MSIYNHDWGTLPKDLIFPVNDIVTFSVEKLFDNQDPQKPQMALECRVIKSEKADENVGEIVMLYFPFKTKTGTSNKNTHKFLAMFFKAEMENRKPIPYKDIIGKMFSAVSTINTYEGKESQKWERFAFVGDVESSGF
jgi:hypothetical protein